MLEFIKRLLGLCKHKWVIKKSCTRKVMHHDEFPALIESSVRSYWADQIVTVMQCEKCSKVQTQMTATHKMF